MDCRRRGRRFGSHQRIGVHDRSDGGKWECRYSLSRRPSLGTINHTLLTLEALRRRRLEIAGVIMAGNRNTDNRRAIERFGKVIVIDEMPHFAPLTPEVLGRWATSEFDNMGQLARYFK